MNSSFQRFVKAAARARAILRRGARLSFPQKLLEASPSWRSHVAIATRILLKVDRGGGKAELSGRKALTVSWSQRQYRCGISHSTLPLMLARRRAKGGPPRFGNQVLPSLRLELTLPCRMSWPRALRGCLPDTRKPGLVSGRQVSKFLERPQRIGRHYAVEGRLNLEDPLSCRFVTRQHKQDRSETGADESDLAHFAAPNVISRTYEPDNSRTRRWRHGCTITSESIAEMCHAADL
jgi:hypothetical protein